jgi:hypothetical protein
MNRSGGGWHYDHEKLGGGWSISAGRKPVGLRPEFRQRCIGGGRRGGRRLPGERQQNVENLRIFRCGFARPRI